MPCCLVKLVVTQKKGSRSPDVPSLQTFLLTTLLDPSCSSSSSFRRTNTSRSSVLWVGTRRRTSPRTALRIIYREHRVVVASAPKLTWHVRYDDLSKANRSSLVCHHSCGRAHAAAQYAPWNNRPRHPHRPAFLRLASPKWPRPRPPPPPSTTPTARPATISLRVPNHSSRSGRNAMLECALGRCRPAANHLELRFCEGDAVVPLSTILFSRIPTPTTPSFLIGEVLRDERAASATTKQHRTARELAEPTLAKPASARRRPPRLRDRSIPGRRTGAALLAPRARTRPSAKRGRDVAVVRRPRVAEAFD